MTKKSYIYYICALIISIVLGVALEIAFLFVSLPTILDGVIFYSSMVLSAFFTFGFVKSTVLSKRNVLLSLIIWNILVFLVSAMTIGILLGGIGSECFLIALPYFIVPCLVITGIVALLYNPKTEFFSKLKNTSERKLIVIKNLCICFIPTILLFIYQMILAAITKIDMSALPGGIQYPMFLSILLWSFIYGLNNVKFTKISVLFSAICNLVCSASATILLYFLHLILKTYLFNTAIYPISYSEYCEYFIDQQNIVPLIIMTVIPSITLCLGALISKYRCKKAEE